MANEQLLSDFNTPHINGVAARRILANEVLHNIYQKEIESEGRGVTQRFSTDVAGAQIRVVRVLPLSQEARELGAGLNGANFNANKDNVSTVEYGLNVITVLDSPFDIATVTEDLLPIDLTQKAINNFGDLVSLNVNAMTIAGKYYKSFIDAEPSLKEIPADTTNYLTPFLEASSLLDDGDEANGVSIFPQDDRILVIRPSIRPKLLAKGVLVIGGSNYAQQMLADGVLSPGAKTAKLQNGYVGDFDNLPCHIASSLIFYTAEKYLGLPRGELDPIIGYFSSGMANARGIAQTESIKIIDSPDGQGKRVQPLVRMGFESFYARGNVFLVSGTFTNPLTFINTLKDNIVKVLAPGSRKVPVLTIEVDEDLKPKCTVVLSNGKSLVTGSNLYYQSKNVDKLTVAEFNAKYAAATVKGTYTSGTALSAPVTAGTYYYYFMAIDSDGTASVRKTTAIVKVES